MGAHKLEQFKVKSEAGDSFHLESPVGHIFTVNKKDLDPKALAIVQKLCGGGGVQKFDDGGTAAPADGDFVWDSDRSPATVESAAADSVLNNDAAPANQDANPPTWIQAAHNWLASRPGLQADPVAAVQAKASQEAGLSPPTADGGPNEHFAGTIGHLAPDLPPATPSPPNPMVQGSLDQQAVLDKQIKDANTYAQQVGAAGGSEAKAYQDYINQIQSQPSIDQIFKNHDAQNAKLMQDVIDSKVDPNRYMKNKSTGGKILAGIAMAISGAGAGRNGTNLAYETIHNAINNDIDAQKNDQSHALNLYKLNQQATQSDVQAHLLSQNQMLSMAQAKAAIAGSGAKSAQAKFGIQQLISGLEMQKASNKETSAMYSYRQQPGGNGTMDVDPTMLVPRKVPEALQKTVFTELGQAKSAAQDGDRLLDLYDQAAKETRPATGGTSGVLNILPGYKPPSIRGLEAMADPLIRDNEGRINTAEQMDLRGIFPKFGDSDSTVQRNRKVFEEFINHKKSAPTATGFGLNPENFSLTSSNPIARMSPQIRQMYDIAKQHPNDPAAKAFFKKYGVQ